MNLVLICNRTLGIHTDEWKKEAEKALIAANDCGIELAQYHLPFRGKRVKCHTSANLEFYNEMFYRAIDIAAFLNIPCGVIHPETLKGCGLINDRCLEMHHEINDKYVEYALSKNLNIAYENMTLGKCAGYC